MKAGDSFEVTKLDIAKRGRKVALGEMLDDEIKRYIQHLRENGTAISITLVQAAAEGYLLGRDRTVLVQYGGHVSLTWDWARSLLRRLGYVKRKATTKANTQLSEDKFQQIKASFLQQVFALVKAHAIPPELIINLDETGIKLVPVGEWSMAPQGSKRVEVAGLGDKRQLTATFADTLSGAFLPMQLLYQGKTDRSHPKFTFPDGFHIYHSPNHWANEGTVSLFYQKVIIPYVAHVLLEKQIPDQKVLLIMDNFKAHFAGDVLQPLEENGVLVIFLPANTTDRLQPLDLSINKAAKDFLRDKFRQWYARQVSQSLQTAPENEIVPVKMPDGVLKELGAKWLVAFYDYICSHPDLVVNGFKEAGILDLLENGVPTVAIPQQDGILSDENQVPVEDPFLDIHSDTDYQ